MEEEKCRGCNHIQKCLTPVNKCPCKNCLVKPVCDVLCYERHLVGAEHLGLEPLSKENFIRIFGKKHV